MSPGQKDWKGIAAIVGSVLAVVGFLWNKAEGCSDRLRNQSVQAASYDALGSKVDALYSRVAALEQVLQLLPTLFKARAADASRIVTRIPRAVVGGRSTARAVPAFAAARVQGDTGQGRINSLEEGLN